MATSRLRRVFSRSAVVLAIGLALLGAWFSPTSTPTIGTQVVHPTEQAGPNPPPDLDHLVGYVPTLGQ